MMTYIGNRKAVARFVSDILLTFGPACSSITITPVERSADCYVIIAIDELLVGTVKNWARTYFKEVTLISVKNIRGG